MADRRSIIVACRTGRGVLVDSETIGFLHSLYRTRKFYLLARVARHLKRTSQLTDRNRFELGFLVGRAGAELDNIALMDEGLRDAVLSEPFTPSITYQFADYRRRRISALSALQRVVAVAGDGALPAGVAEVVRVLDNHGNGGVMCRVIGDPPFFNTARPPSRNIPNLHILSVAPATIRRRGYATFVFQGNTIIQEISGPFAEILQVQHAQEKLFGGDASGFLKISGTSVLISDNYSGNNYAHWILDYLPRLFLCARETERVDSVIAFQVFSPFHRQGIDLVLGHPAILVDLDRDTNIQAERLVVPNNIQNIGQTASHPIHHASRQAIEAYARFMDDAARRDSAQSGSLPQRIYISRQKSRRKIINAEEIEALLRRDGFTRVFLEDMDFASQIILFSQANAVFGLHGAGMANIVFCKPGTHIYEYFLDGVGSSAFAQLSGSIGLHYSASSFTQGPSMPDELKHEQDTYVDPTRLLDWLGTLTRPSPP